VKLDFGKLKSRQERKGACADYW